MNICRCTHALLIALLIGLPVSGYAKKDKSEDSGTLDLTLCDGRPNETGRQVSINRAGSVVTRSYGGCND